MNPQLYVVKRDHPEANPGFIEGVFSNEGLAMTHASKLRLAQVESGSTFYVEPLVADEYTEHEVCYIAYISIDIQPGLTIPFNESAIAYGKAGLQRALPEADTVDRANRTTGMRFFLFREYGWTPMEARTRLIAHARGYLSQSDAIWQHIPAEPKEEQVPA